MGYHLLFILLGHIQAAGLCRSGIWGVSPFIFLFTCVPGTCPVPQTLRLPDTSVKYLTWRKAPHIKQGRQWKAPLPHYPGHSPLFLGHSRLPSSWWDMGSVPAPMETLKASAEANGCCGQCWGPHWIRLALLPAGLPLPKWVGYTEFPLISGHR